jgi:hypothetical protein
MPRDSKTLFFAVCVFASVLLFGIEIDKKLGVFFGSLIGLGFYTTQVTYPGIYQFLCFGAGAMLLLQLQNKDVDFNLLGKVMAYSCLFQAIVVMFNYFGVNLYSDSIAALMGYKVVQVKAVPNVLVAGTLGHPNVVGAFMAITMPFVIKHVKKLSFLPVIAVVMTDCAMPVVTLAVCALFWFIRRLDFKYFKTIMLGVVTCGAYAIISMPSLFNGRLPAWKGAINMTSLFGRGFYFFVPVFNKLSPQSEKFTNVHNEYLEFLVIFGLFGVAWLIYLIYHYRAKLFKSDVTYGASFVALMANSVGNFTFHTASTALVGIITISGLLNSRRINGNMEL